jgi:demethylmenaquinone methyltransferase/2-methoxy-6-polyprenyl-1,4-benzoquinol methylase
MANANTDATLSEQRQYYQARAPEYDEWFLRRGRYDQGHELNQRWEREVGEVREALGASGVGGDMLEMATGTGWWTERLGAMADHITALDASPETLEIARERLRRVDQANRVTFVPADLFTWKPERTYDAVFFSFWITHVPDERLDAFVATVSAALRPGGTIFWVDSRREQTGTAPDQPLPNADDQIMTRRLNDGRTFQIIKRFRSAAAYEQAFAEHDIDLTVSETETYFQYAVGRKRG